MNFVGDGSGARTMTADERFDLIWHKVDRANKHIGDLSSAIVAFMASNPYEVGVKRDPETKRPVYYVKGVSPIPHEISNVMGDAIQNLRSALDHLAQQLFLVGSGSSVFRKDTSFFIHEKRSEYKKHVGGKVTGMRSDAIEALCALEPYKGGKGHDFWTLHALNNIDKHRMLVAVEGQFRSVDVLAAFLPSTPPAVRAVIERTKSSLFIIPAEKTCPLRIGDELFIGLPDREIINPNVPFSITVALNEPEVVEPGPMLEIALRLADLVSNTVRAFKPFLV